LIAEQLFRLCIDQHDLSMVVSHDDRVGSGFEQASEPVFGFEFLE